MTQRMGNSGRSDANDSETQRVVDFTVAREKRLEEKRRHTERIFFRNLISVYSVTGRGQSKMYPIELIDISEDGLSFQVPLTPDKSWPKDSGEIPIRLYFSQDTYFEVLVKVQNSRPAIEKNQKYTRYGCKVDKDTQSYPAYQGFVKFLKLYAEHAHKDMGDVSVFYL